MNDCCLLTQWSNTHKKMFSNPMQRGLWTSVWAIKYFDTKGFVQPYHQNVKWASKADQSEWSTGVLCIGTMQLSCSYYKREVGFETSGNCQVLTVACRETRSNMKNGRALGEHPSCSDPPRSLWTSPVLIALLIPADSESCLINAPNG